ncbi:hypothetical protein DL546_003708 [Coniochaeta pulveracea]|uniref:C2H2-type domain-containing protein n=1 Tax=Coniochaeta pulveracea TaxID=177199 RepID=A0A420Y3P9_9PEZI|nr:hypothetical protein DL546_003708 [Coniochaeta pulveracea]
MLPSMSEWKTRITRVKSRCGFCGETFSVWSDRNDHLAEHFRSGATMRDWKGCRGLEPQVALLVENAMPPYLIGIGAVDLEPFSASKLATKANGIMVPNSEAPRTPFETLTARLGEFVKVTRESGITITDELLQKQARLILYGDDDPWNQTPADNTEWLELFKKGYGLLSTPSACTVTTARTSDSCPGVHRSPFSPEKMRRAAFGIANFGPPEDCGAQHTT